MAKYLIVGPSWVGDMVMAQSLFITLRQHDKEAIIDVIGPNWSLPILARMPEVRNAITLPTGHGEWGIRTRRKLGHSLRSEKYDQSIVIPRSWKSALVPFFANIPHRVGFKGEQRYILLNERRRLDKGILNQTVKRFTSLGLPNEQAYPPANIPSPALRVDPTNLKRLYEQHNLSNKPAIALMAGAEFGPSKQWPIAYFHQLAKSAVNSGYQVWVLGGPKDQADGDKIVAELGEFAINLCGKTQLVDAIDLLSAAEKAVSNDSGLMHIAASVGTEVHGIYGSTSELFTPPLTENKTIHNLHLECSPCFKRTCPLGHTNCQNQLLPEMLIDALNLSSSESSL
ncbi:lipopolysaccharide heptosyltransferase II [Marinomonas sp. CT5]|uniref:lipopolysaccharide heptosyltransferase II n=1 Tax=Marinomonas sp. CT5 TaxID=2066133 RepID=UPI0017DD9058|nr:lipopolysaccharide heptosyltransferase II [Marinomonas sp. CT5]NVK72697.1 lipopolysaccharide heptosyltransferase II [Oceanospirillaceae bacterium]QUX96878.1 lipopolysaccharide heptosyltransferase II [Marinomonas sp. CT5]